MATASGAFSTYPSFLTYRLDANEVATYPASNQSLVRVTANVDFSGSSASSAGGSGNISVAGTYNWSWGSISFSGAGSTQVGTNDWLITHETDGTKTVTFSGSASFSGWGSATTNTGSLTLTPFNLAAGKRWTGSTWTDCTINKRWNGSAWVDLTIKKRWSGSAWVDLS